MINPFYWLELRIRAHEKRLWVIALFFLLSVLLIGGGILLVAVVDSAANIVPGELGQGITYTLLFWHGAIIIVMAPLASAGRIAQEREQRTLPALINTTVNVRSIVWGKLAAAWVFILWLSALVLPFLGVGVIWGGIPVWKVLASLLINISVSMVIATIALGFSGLMGRSLSAYLITGSFMLGWMIVLPILGGISMAICESADAEGVKKIIPFVFFYNNPFFPTILLSSGEWVSETKEMLIQLGYCFTCWLLLGWGGIAMAIKGLKKDVY